MGAASERGAALPSAIRARAAARTHTHSVHARCWCRTPPHALRQLAMIMHSSAPLAADIPAHRGDFMDALAAPQARGVRRGYLLGPRRCCELNKRACIVTTPAQQPASWLGCRLRWLAHNSRAVALASSQRPRCARRERAVRQLPAAHTAVCARAWRSSHGVADTVLSRRSHVQAAVQDVAVPQLPRGAGMPEWRALRLRALGERCGAHLNGSCMPALPRFDM